MNMWNGYRTIAKGLEGDRWAGIEVQITDGRLSVCGVIGHPAQLRRANADACGQIIDDIANLPDDKLVNITPAERDHLVSTWRRWHLNDMRAGCEHQQAEQWDRRPIDPSKALDTYGKHFPGQRQDTWNMLTWVRPSEHPDGLLGKECDECGYAFGTAWIQEDLPADVIAWAKSWAEQ